MSLSVYSRCDTSGYVNNVQAIKSHFGIYVAQFKDTNLLTNNDPSHFTLSPYQELVQNPCLRGHLTRCSWTELEGPGINDYTRAHTLIDGWLAALPPGKFLQVLIEFKSYDPVNREDADHIAPEYARNATYGGGETLYNSTLADNTALSGGYVQLYWNANVRARMVALAQYLGARYNSDPRFEGIGSVEAAFQNPVGFITLPPDYEDQQFIGLFMFMTQLKASFPNCHVFQFVNYPRSNLVKYINGGTFGTPSAGQYNWPGLRNMGIGMGGPNLAQNEWPLGGYDASRIGQFDNSTPPKPLTPQIISGVLGAFAHYTGDFGANSPYGEIPFCPSAQRPDWSTTKLVPGGMPPPDGGHEPTVAEVLGVARDTLRGHYFFATRAGGNTGQYPKNSWGPFMNYLAANPSIRNNITGGFATSKPSTYPAMITD